MRRLLLIRHGETPWNLEGRIQGQSMDVPLTDRGTRQAHTVAARVATMVPAGTQIISSDQLRAVTTAEIIAEHLRSTVSTTPLLREQHLGDMEGKLPAELTPLPTPAGVHVSEVRWAGGESVEDVWQRSYEFLRALPAGKEPLILVGHGDALRILATVIAGKTHRDVDYSQRLSNADVWDLTWESKLRYGNESGC